MVLRVEREAVGARSRRRSAAIRMTTPATASRWRKNRRRNSCHWLRGAARQVPAVAELSSAHRHVLGQRRARRARGPDVAAAESRSSS